MGEWTDGRTDAHTHNRVGPKKKKTVYPPPGPSIRRTKQQVLPRRGWRPCTTALFLQSFVSFKTLSKCFKIQLRTSSPHQLTISYVIPLPRCCTYSIPLILFLKCKEEYEKLEIKNPLNFLDCASYKYAHFIHKIETHSERYLLTVESSHSSCTCAFCRTKTTIVCRLIRGLPCVYHRTTQTHTELDHTREESQSSDQNVIFHVWKRKFEFAWQHSSFFGC